MTAAHQCETFTLFSDDEDPICLACGHYACTNCKAVHALAEDALCAACLKAVAPSELSEAMAADAAYRQAVANLDAER